ncbi:MAG: HD domain-containing protein [Candidatus Eremiobacteraeota bacterium]|nr:HD domain-containing protein [Candidatus Eremiobacteraeota bacterium]
MPKIFDNLNKTELMLLLNYQLELDELLDKAMIDDKDIKTQIGETVKLTTKYLRRYLERNTGSGKESLWVLFFDHLSDPVIITNEDMSKEKIIDRFFDLLQEENLLHGKVMRAWRKDPDLKDSDASLARVGQWMSDTMKRKEDGTFHSERIILEELKVHHRFLGFIMLTGTEPDNLINTMLSQFARKIDTDIFSHNRMMFEKIKSEGFETINRVLDCELPMSDKYDEVLKLIVNSIKAYSGYLVVPKHGKLGVTARYILEDEAPVFSDPDILSIADKAIKKAKNSNVFIRTEEIDICRGELLTVLLKPGEGHVEGVLILHHFNFKEEHRGIVEALSSLIDSSLHVDRLYSLMFKNFINAMGKIIDTFDTYTSGHSNRVSTYSLELGKALGLTDLEAAKLHIASILHDIGKVGVDPNIIRKKSKLSEEEMEKVREHAKFSGNILDGVFPFDMGDIHTLAMSHHEKENGSGYPKGITRKKIPLLSKIISVADIFDALTSDRPYHRGRTREQAYEIMKKEIEEGKLPASLTEKFMSNDVWEAIRSEFFNLKVTSALEWYRKKMLPDLLKLENEAHFMRRCLGHIDRIGNLYADGKEITLLELDDTFLYPADKDRLVQRDYQDNNEKYMKIVGDIRKSYEENLKKIQNRIDLERKFKKEFWDFIIFNEIRDVYTDLAGKDNCLHLPLKEFYTDTEMKTIPESQMSIIRYFEKKLNESEKLKGLNRDYFTPLEELHKIGKHLSKSIEKPL